ncbi:MAG: hypothetical protein LLG16_07510 [Euryarchaeota archaeon]|nr:hypothetical protein [Euryarchaeota archaeon]
MKVVFLTGYGHDGDPEDRTCLVNIGRSNSEGSLRALRCFESELIRSGAKGVRRGKKSFNRVRSILHQYELDMLFVPCIDESRPDHLRK